MLQENAGCEITNIDNELFLTLQKLKQIELFAF